MNSSEEIQKEVDRLNKKFHKRLTAERYQKLREDVRRSNARFYFDNEMTVDQYLEEKREESVML